MPKARYPEILVVELGVDHPGDMQRLLGIVQPSVSVVTNTRNTHLQNFDSIEAIARENRHVVEVLPENGLAILNHDEDPTREMAHATAACVITYGFSDGARLRITGHRFSRHGQTVQLKDSSVPTSLTLKTRLLGEQQLYGVAAAVAVGREFGVSDDAIAESVATFDGPPGRMRLFSAADEGVVIDDTYNASPQAVVDSLRVLDHLPHPRVAVLGTMGELGDDFAAGHDRVGTEAAQHVDYLVVLGEGGERIATAARSAGLSQQAITQAHSIREAVEVVSKHLRASTLVKASQALYLERVVVALIEPENEPQTLQRLSRLEHQRNLLKAPPEG
jgi:UDP-N-acetylmuramoyl-tripeptide--D-alanyl-D-alanine ligase